MMILATIVCYFAILLLIARITGRKGGSNAAFFKGENQSPWYVVAFGMIGASISGVTFVSVPGMVKAMDMTYMQTVFGFFFGYLAVAHILLPLYYKLNQYIHLSGYPYRKACLPYRSLFFPSFAYAGHSCKTIPCLSDSIYLRIS